MDSVVSNITLANQLYELRELEKIAKDMWFHHYKPIIGYEQVSYMLEKFQSLDAMRDQISKGYQYYLVKEDDSIIAYFAVQQRNSVLFLSKFYVHHSKQGVGIGKTMQEFIENLALAKDAKSIELTVNKRNIQSIGFYKSQGYKRTGEICIDIGAGFVMDDYAYSKDLSSI